MHYYLYEIKNNLNNKVYIGVHTTCELDDGYMGSGTVIKAAIEKYGFENFTKTILATFDTSDAMYAREKEIVTEEFLSRNDVYNLRIGGDGGWDYVHSRALHHGFSGKHHTTATKQWLSDIGKTRIMADSTRRKLSENNWSKSSPGKQKEHASRAAKIGNEKRDDTVKEKISASMSKVWETRLEITCPYCGFIGRGGTMKRWHFEKCKNKGAFI